MRINMISYSLNYRKLFVFCWIFSGTFYDVCCAPSDTINNDILAEVTNIIPVTNNNSTASTLLNDETTNTQLSSNTISYHDTSSVQANLQSDSSITDENPVANVQKCCPLGQALVVGQPGEKGVCEDSSEQLLVDIYVANDTHYWLYQSNQNASVQLHVKDPCKHNKFALDPDDENDTYILLLNSSLYIPNDVDMLDTSEYCMDVISTNVRSYTTVFICTDPPKTNLFAYLYPAGQFISAICLIGMTVYFIFRKDIPDKDHETCLIGFFSTMALAFVFMAVSNFFLSFFSYLFTTVLAYFIYYFTLTYYIWLNILCYETYRCIKKAETNKDFSIERDSYMKWYYIIAFSIPVLFILINFADGLKPAMPNLFNGYVFSSSSNWCLALFFIPTGISVTINLLIFLISLPKRNMRRMSSFINFLRYEVMTDGTIRKSVLKKLHRRSCFLIFCMWVFWFLDIIFFYLPSSGEQQSHFIVRDVLCSLQGFFISCIFLRKCGQKSTENGTELQAITSENHRSP